MSVRLGYMVGPISSVSFRERSVLLLAEASKTTFSLVVEQFSLKWHVVASSKYCKKV